MKSTEFIRWCDSIDLVNESEICRRNFASRYYYGLFHIVLESFEDMPSYSNIGTHCAVSEFLERGYVGNLYDKKELRKLSYMMKQAKGFRVKADYTISHEFSIEDCFAAKAAVVRCLSKLEEILKVDLDLKSASMA